MKRVYICSPLRPTRGYTLEQNLELARKLCRRASLVPVAAFAPHLFYTQFLDDGIEAERVLGMFAGNMWLDVADEVWVYALMETDLTVGMRAEVERANHANKVVRYMPRAFEGIGR